MAARRWNPAHHPRDKFGRFTRSATKVMTAAEKKRAVKTLDGFQPVRHTDRQDGRTYLASIHGSGRSPAVQDYFDGDWKQTNAALRAGKTPSGVTEIDAAMRPLPDDVVLRRQIPADVFGQVPLEELPGLKLRDAAYASTALDTPGLHLKPGSVIMHIAAPAGTPVVVDSQSGEILLARDTEIAIFRVAQNKQGGWDVYGTVLPKAPTRKPKSAPKRPATSRTPKPATGPEPEAKPPAPTKSAPTDGPLSAAPKGLHRDDSGLSDGEQAALAAYQDGDNGVTFKTINGALRAGTTGRDVDATAIAGIDSAMAGSALTSDVTVHRGIRNAQTTFGADRVSGDLTGMRWRDDGFVSTTADEQAATSFSGRSGPLRMRIQVPAGVNAVDLSDPDDRSEAELLLDRGHEFEVVKDHGVVDGTRLVDVEMHPKGSEGDDGSAPAAAEPAASDQAPATDRLDDLAAEVNADVTGFEARTAQTPKSPIDLHLQQIGISQGFDDAPRIGTKAELDAAVASGWTETWRGVMATGSGITPAEINAQLRTGAYEPGRGYYGNGYYMAERRLTGENFRGAEPKTDQPAGGGTDFELSDLESVDEPDSLLRIAIDPAAKTADFDELVAEQKQWIASQPADSPAAKTFADVGRYAAARGIDVISVSGDHPDGGYYPGWEEAFDELSGAVQYVVLNRAVMLIQRAEDQP